jgi:hypothetical protein
MTEQLHEQAVATLTIDARVCCWGQRGRSDLNLRKSIGGRCHRDRALSLARVPTNQASCLLHHMPSQAPRTGTFLRRYPSLKLRASKPHGRRQHHRRQRRRARLQRRFSLSKRRCMHTLFGFSPRARLPMPNSKVGADMHVCVSFRVPSMVGRYETCRSC